MPKNSTLPLAHRMRSGIFRHALGEGPTDQGLLATFVASRDEEAFAELVRRHGPMVLAVCRRVTGHAQDAEDAFQAAFMVLARRAGQVGRPELLGNWLYGVAFRTALEARNARRRLKELQPVDTTPEPAGPTPPEHDPDLRRMVDEELAQLPEKYRSAVVLCDIEGLSRKDAASRLRVPEGTLSSRLAQARKLLADRFTRRGITASVAAVSAALGRDAAGTALPTPLVQLTARAAAQFAPGGAVPPDLISNRVSTLTDGVMKTMILNRLRLTTGALVVCLGILGLGAVAVTGQGPGPKPGANPATNDPFVQAPATKDKVKGPEKITAKGIEDDEVPLPSVPEQAVARLEGGEIILRQRQRAYKAIHTGQVVSYQPTTRVSGHKFDAADLSVFDMKGNRVTTKVWKEKLKDDQHVLVAYDGRLPHPRELALFKDDALLIVFPSSPLITPPPAPAPPVPTGFVPQTTSRPVRQPDGSIQMVPSTTYQPDTGTTIPPFVPEDLPTTSGMIPPPLTGHSIPPVDRQPPRPTPATTPPAPISTPPAPMARSEQPSPAPQTVPNGPTVPAPAPAPMPQPAPASAPLSPG